MSSSTAPTVTTDVRLITEPLRTRLHELAARVADDLEQGCLEAAWTRTRGLEREVDPVGAVTARPVPPAPVIGRRFAAAHRARLQQVDATDVGGAVAERRHPAA